MKTGITLMSALMLVSSGSVLAQQTGQQPGQDRPAQEGQQQPGQDRAGQTGQDRPGQTGQDRPGQTGQDRPGQAGQDRAGQAGQDRAGQAGERDHDTARTDRRQQGPITSRSAGQIRSDELVGSDVLDSAGESVGDVDQLLIDDEGRIVALIVNVGGTLGMGGKTVALAWDDANVERDEDDDSYKVRTTMTEQQLEDAPEFEDDGGLFGGRN